MGFEQNILVCVKGCKNRRRTAPGRVECSFSGRRIGEHASDGICGDPQVDRFTTAAASALGRSGEAGAQRQCVCDGGEGLAAAKRRVELLAPICRGCDQMVSITVRSNPLAAGVLCKAAPACCGGGPGTIDLVYGACIELKHEAAIAQWQSEREGGGACH